MNPNLGISRIQELVQTTRMVQVKMSNNDFFDVFDAIPRSFNRCTEFMARLVVHTCKDFGHSWTPDSRVILATSCLPKDQAFVRVLDQDTVHR